MYAYKYNYIKMYILLLLYYHTIHTHPYLVQLLGMWEQWSPSNPLSQWHLLQPHFPLPLQGLPGLWGPPAGWHRSVAVEQSQAGPP